MFRASACVFIVLFFSHFALAHHGGSEYDLGKTVEFKAKLTRVDLINPHSWLYFDVTEKDGKISHHRCEMRSVHVLRRSGWTQRSVSRRPADNHRSFAQPNGPRFLLSADDLDRRRDPYGSIWSIHQGSARWYSGSSRPDRYVRAATARSGGQRESQTLPATGRRCRASWLIREVRVAGWCPSIS